MDTQWYVANAMGDRIRDGSHGKAYFFGIVGVFFHNPLGLEIWFHYDNIEIEFGFGNHRFKYLIARCTQGPLVYFSETRTVCNSDFVLYLIQVSQGTECIFISNSNLIELNSPMEILI